MQSTLLARSAITVLCTRVKPALLQVAALCLLVSKLLVQVGVLHTLRRLNSRLVIFEIKKPPEGGFFIESSE
jgi:hypothetical protein